MPTAKKTPSKGANLHSIDGGGARAASYEKYRTLFEQASDPIATFHLDGSIDDANQALEELSGFLKSELKDKGMSAFQPVMGGASESQKIPARARTFSPTFLEVPGTYEDVALVRKDGYIRVVDVSVRQVQESGQKEPLALVLFRDLSEKKRMERELITKHAELKNAYFELEKKTAELSSMQDTLVQAGKMAALGELAAGIAHELNQPLQAIRGYAQEVGYVAEKDSKAVSEGLSEIIRNVDKMAQIIQYLRTHVRKSSEGFEETSLHGAIDEALKMLSRQFQSRGVRVVKNFASDFPQIYANPLQLEQLFINLSTNARDAIESTGRGSGVITIATKFDGKFVEIEFSDDGIGMDQKTKQKAFNPFFTTKEVGHGMGMGLSISYGVVSKLHGSIVVESELRKGTTFKVRLPRDYRELA